MHRHAGRLPNCHNIIRLPQNLPDSISSTIRLPASRAAMHIFLIVLISGVIRLRECIRRECMRRGTHGDREIQDWRLMPVDVVAYSLPLSEGDCLCHLTAFHPQSSIPECFLKVGAWSPSKFLS